MSVIKIKRGTTDPTASNVTNAGELAANTSTPKVFLKTADDSATTPVWVGAQIEATPGDWTSAVKLPTQSAVNTTFMPKAGGTFSSNVSFSGGADIRFIETGGGTDFIAFQGPASIATSVTFTLPSADGTSGQVLTTNGSGTLSWAGASATNVTVLGNNGATVVYPLFATGTGVGVDVYADASTTPLSYYPDTSILKASTFQGNVKSSADGTALTLTGTSTSNEDPAILTLTGNTFPNSTASLSASSITLTATAGYTLTGGTITHSGSALELPTTYTIQDSATGVNSTLNIAGQSTASTFSKTVNIGVNTASGGTSNVNIATAMNAAGTAAITIGSTAGTSATTLNGTVTVANDIAVNGGDITTSSGTATLFNTNATTVNVAGAGTTVSIGAATGTTTINNANTVVTGDLAVNGADITTSSTGTATLFNTNATTLNVGQAATAISMGATTGTTTVRNDLNLPTGKVYQINSTSVLSASALGSGVVSSSLTSVGTIGTGVWQGTDIGVVYGGTGTSDGSITGTGALTFTAGGTNTNVNLVPLGSGTVDVGSKRITNLAAPSASTDAATRAYVDNVAQGLHVHAVAKGATTTTLATLAGVAVSYSGGTQAITWTGGTAVTSSFTDGVTFAANTTEASASRIVVKNEADVGGLGAAYNGIYYCYGARELRRTTDSNAAAEFAGGDFVFVTDGTTYNNTGWVQTEVVTTLDTDPIAFDQFSGAGTMIADEITLTKSGDTFSIKNTYIGQSSITTLGTIGTGIWNGTVIGLTYGGTGKALVAAAGGIVWSDADSLEITTAGTSGYVLTSGGTATPTWTNATDANTASAIVKRDASGNFTAGTMTGTASNASAVTMASSTDTTSYLAFVSDASATSQGLKYNSSLLYNATTNYLDANIDGGTY